jgi:hypothetical protein
MTNFCTTCRMISGDSALKAMVASSRLRNSGVNRRLIAASSSSVTLPRQSRCRPDCCRRPRVGGHDQDHVAEIDLLADGVRQRAVVHDLQQDVEHVGVRLLDLVEQDDAVRVLVDLIGQQPPLVVADVARRRADQPADRVPLHVLRHVEAQQLDPERGAQLLGDLGLADAGRAAEEVAADGLLRVAKARAGHLHGGGQLLDRVVLAVDRALQVELQAAQRLGVRLADRLGRNARHLGDDRLDLLLADHLLAIGLGHQHLARARLVDHVDRLVGQLAVVDVLGRQLHRRLDRPSV